MDSHTIWLGLLSAMVIGLFVSHLIHHIMFTKHLAEFHTKQKEESHSH